MFLFVVRRLHWLARVPLLPQLFDALLLTWTCVARRPRLAAMEELERRVLALPGVCLRVHRFGGTEFGQAGHELGHLHGNGLLDARVAPGVAAALIAAGTVRAHHIFPPRSGWVSLPLESCADVPLALEILEAAAQRSSQNKR